MQEKFAYHANLAPFYFKKLDLMLKIMFVFSNSQAWMKIRNKCMECMGTFVSLPFLEEQKKWPLTTSTRLQMIIFFQTLRIYWQHILWFSLLFYRIEKGRRYWLWKRIFLQKSIFYKIYDSYDLTALGWQEFKHETFPVESWSDFDFVLSIYSSQNK